MKFTFTVPVWGDWHLLQYMKHVLPSHAAAGLEGKYIVHTTKIGRRTIEHAVRSLMWKCKIQYVEVDPVAEYFQFSKYHQEAFDKADACMFLQADAIISQSTFVAVRKAVEAGAKHINCAGINTVEDGTVPPFDKGLNKWAVDHLIPTLRDNVWGTSDVLMSPQTLFFRDGDAFWTHAFHHDPICIVNDGRGVKFADSTLDWITPSFFKPEETCVLSGHDALVVEISPPVKFDRHPRYQMVNATEVALQVRDKVLPSHINLFAHPVPIVGEPTKKYAQFIDDVLALLWDQDFYARRAA